MSDGQGIPATYFSRKTAESAKKLLATLLESMIETVETDKPSVITISVGENRALKIEWRCGETGFDCEVK